ncbi:MAG: hypothetical protein ABL907_19985 [Hyphomicrobium sp.]
MSFFPLLALCVSAVGYRIEHRVYRLSGHSPIPMSLNQLIIDPDHVLETPRNSEHLASHDTFLHFWVKAGGTSSRFSGDCEVNPKTKRKDATKQREFHRLQSTHRRQERGLPEALHRMRLTAASMKNDSSASQIIERR